MQTLDTILRNDAWSLVRFVSNKKPSSFNNFLFYLQTALGSIFDLGGERSMDRETMHDR